MLRSVKPVGEGGFVAPAARVRYSIWLGQKGGPFRLASWLEPFDSQVELPTSYGKIVREWVVGESSTLFVMDNQATKNRPYAYVGLEHKQLGELLSDQCCFIDGYVDVDDVRYDLQGGPGGGHSVIDSLLAGDTDIFEFGGFTIKTNSFAESGSVEGPSIRVYSDSDELLYSLTRIRLFPSGSVKSFRYKLSDSEWWEVSCKEKPLGSEPFDEFAKTRKPMTEFVELEDRHGEVFTRKKGIAKRAVDSCLSEHDALFIKREGFVYKDYIRRRSSKHCGLYAAINVAIEKGVSSIDIETVLGPKYVSVPSGSTVNDLKRLLRTEFGIEATVSRNADVEYLRGIRGPAILHFGRSYQAEGAAHWVAFLGLDEQGRFRIVDAPHTENAMSAAELLTQWDGLVLFPDGPNSGSLRIHGLQLYSVASRLIYCSVFALLAYLTQLWIGLKKIGFFSSLLLVAAAILASTYCSQHVNTNSYWNNQQSVTFALSKSHLVADVPCIETNDDTCFENAQVVDARMPISFAAGHFEDAYSLPVDASLEETKSVIRALGDKDKAIVVYCQSSSCQWADLVCKRLKFFGFRDVVIYRPGWAVLGERISTKANKSQ